MRRLAALCAATLTFAGLAAVPAAAVAVEPLPTLVINEVESNGGTPGDWIELYNTGDAPVDAAGLVLKDNDDTHRFEIPAGTTIAAHSAAAFDVETAYGLGKADSARLYLGDGSTLIDSYSWTAHADETYGRCPDGIGPRGRPTSARRRRGPQTSASTRSSPTGAHRATGSSSTTPVRRRST
jgi:hypothetical protein